MKNVFKLLLSAVILFAAVPSANAQATMCAETCEMACADEVKKKKKKKKKIGGAKGKKKKKGFFSKVFGSK
jgi:hypothetical protein